eukprot:325831_1
MVAIRSSSSQVATTKTFNIQPLAHSLFLRSSCPEMSTFNDWLFRNGIRIPESLHNKMKAQYIDSVDVLAQLKKMGGNKMADVLQQLQLNTIEEAIFNVILSKLGGDSAPGECPQVMMLAPQIISISDNKNGSVNVKWKLSPQPLDNNHKNRLKLEWADDEKALDMDHTNDEIIDTNNIELDVVHQVNNVRVHNINANVFRLKWRNFSNAKVLQIETDRWDANHKGQHIEVDGNVIKHTATTSWNSIYGQVLCKAPFTYHWKFRVKNHAIYFMFGVAQAVNEYKCKDTYLGATQVGYYAAYNTKDIAYIYDKNGNVTGQYGMQRFNTNGCVLDMYLDLKNYQLKFETNGEDIGHTIKNLGEVDYRMIVSLYNKQVIELVAFDYHK